MDEVETLAIVGLAARFPGARNIVEFWRNLCEGVESITFFSDEEIIADGGDPAVVRQPNYVKARGVLGDADLMDAPFFGLHPREAALMDPQHRVFLECAWEALEHAGYDPEGYKGRIGVFGGQSMNTYLLNNIYPHIEMVQSVESLQASIGNDKDSLTTEVAYRMGLTGPAVTIQSSSSTSLVAVHYACQSLLTYECDLALAGGVSIHFPEKAGYLYYPGGTSSSDGHGRTFDARADGFVAGHGAGIVVLKRLSEALRDGDTIYAVVRGSAVNNDGSTKVSYMAPSVEGQARVIAMAHAIAGVKPEQVGYVEAHGTATLVGDPIEVAALTQAFRSGTDRKGYCTLGSVKPNIGHLDSAAGVAGLIKTVLALHNKTLPPTLHFEQPNPNIDFENSPFVVSNQLANWETDGSPRIAGVSSFGMGGTNAHVILGEAPAAAPSGPARAAQLVLLSAKTGTALESMTANLAKRLGDQPEPNLADLAFTLQIGRKRLSHRRMLVCHNAAEAREALSACNPEKVFSSVQEPRSRAIYFMFSGQGAQYVDMGKQLYEQEKLFRETVDRCAVLLQPHLGLDIREVLYPSPEKSQAAGEQLLQTGLAQCALFTIEYAMAQLWISWGIRPQAMIGHSIGEYVAACLAGVFSLEDALRLVAARGRLMQQMPAGAMLAVSLTEQEAQAWLTDESLSLAAVNGPAICVISGPNAAVDALQQRLESDGKACRRLHTSHAFHSAMMEPILGAFRQEAQRIRFQAPSLAYLSNLTGTWITAGEATDPDYWVRHLRHAVRFADGISKILEDQEAILLELGPGQTLSTLARLQIGPESRQESLASLRHPNDTHADMDFLLNTLGRLWMAGAEVDWNAYHARERRRRIALPTYPFERQRYWIEAAEPASGTSPATRHAKTGKQAVSDWFYLPSWKEDFTPRAAKPGTPKDQADCWMLFVPDAAHSLGARLARRLAAEGHTIVTIQPGSAFSQADELAFSVRPAYQQDYHALMTAIGQAGLVPEKIVHLWNVSSDVDIPFEASQEQGLHSLLALARALGARTEARPTSITVVTCGAQQVNSAESIRPDQATVLGVCRVLPQEYGNLVCKTIDVSLPQAGSAQESHLVEQLAAECEADNAPEHVVAYRGGQHWVQAFEPLRLETQARTLLREHGVYLVTGGLGNVGYALATALAKETRARLVLVGRSVPPARETWTEWLATHDAENVTSRRIKMIQALEELGAEVLAAGADVSDPAQMKAVVEQARARFGAIHGVVHAAGNVGQALFRAIKDMTHEDAQAHFAAKVKGVQVLEAVLGDEPLDFCLLTSSIAAVLGGLGLAGYAAANQYMDAFVQRHNQTHPVAWLSVNWDAWQVTADQFSVGGHPFGEVAIASQEGADSFLRLLGLAGHATGQVLVSTTELQPRLDQWITREVTPAGESLRANSGGPTARPNLATAYVAPRNPIEQEIAEVWQTTLGIGQVGVYDSFFELGGNSLVGVQLISQLSEKWSVQIPVVSLYEGPTVGALAKIITELVAPETQVATGEDPARTRGERLRERRRRRVLENGNGGTEDEHS